MEVVVTARNAEVSDRYRAHVAEKLAKLEKHDHRIIRINVEVDNEPNPRQHDHARATAGGQAAREPAPPQGPGPRATARS